MISRATLVMRQQGDPFLGFGALVGGLRKLGGSIIGKFRGGKGPLRSVAGVLTGGAAAGAAGAGIERAFPPAGGGAITRGTVVDGSIDGFLAIRSAKTGKILRLISPAGRIVRLTRRRGGLSARELRGFHKVAHLLGAVGMRPSTHRRRRK